MMPAVTITEVPTSAAPAEREIPPAAGPGQDPPSPPAPPRPEARRRRPEWFHRPSRSGWITAAIALVATALYTWNLGASGTANSYYTAAVKSGTVSWKAFFFGSIDPGNFITVDKPPAALWVQALSGRIFGFST